MSKTKRRQLLMAVLAASVAGGTLASSHREAPFITTRPKVDGTDFYMFNSYEVWMVRMFDRRMLAVPTARVAGGTLASSHREAPFITTRPKVDGTDFYMFNSYEAGRPGFVTLIANYLPLQDPQGGPNYFFLDDNALYEISI